MTTSFDELLKNRQKSFETLAAELNKTNAPKFQEDDRVWYPGVDKAGNGYAVIRFLPQPKGENSPYAKLWYHSFQGPTGLWYIENCRSTLGQPDPVMEVNNVLWNSGDEDKKNLARKQGRKLVYISNILVIKDPANPDNEGKVFLYRYGKKIFNKLNALMNPEFPDEKPINPFDFIDGCNFRLKIKQVGDFRNYDDSEFVKPPAPLSNDMSYLEMIWNQEYSLAEFLQPSQFKSYDDLKVRLDRVLGTVGQMPAAAPAMPTAAKKTGVNPLPAVEDDDEGDDEVAKKLRLFKQLAESE